MATAVNIPAPICETREEQGGDLVDQASSNLINKLPNEEQSQADTHNVLPMVEGGNFLTPPLIGEVHCEVNNSSPDVSMVTEKPDQTVKDEADTLGKPKSDDQPTAIAANEETFSGGIQQNVEESDGLDKEEIKESKTHGSEGEEMYVQAETTFEKVGDVKPIEEDILENPKSGNIVESSAESLHVAPENTEASILGQEKNMKSLPKDKSSNVTLHENAGGETEEKSTDAGTQKEILESLSTVASSSPEDESINAVPLEVSRDSANEKIIDGVGTRKVLENDFSNEDDKGNSTEHGEPGNVEICENESTQSTVLKIEPKIEKSEDPLQATSEDIKAPETETRSCNEEQSATHPQGILDEKTEDEAEMEGIIENVPTIVSIEKTEDNSWIQVGGPKMENEDHSEKDTEQPSQVEDYTGNLVTDEVKIDDENPSRAELLEEENTESSLLKEEMQKDKSLESLHAVEDIKPSDLDQHTVNKNFLKEKSPIENPQEILGEETEEKTIDAVSNEENSKNSLIKVDAREMEKDAYLEKEMEPSLTKPSVEDANHDESINLVETKIGNECDVVLQNASEDHKASASCEDIETALSHKEECSVMSDITIDATNTEDATHDIHNVTTEIQHEPTEENSVPQVDCSQIEQEEHLEKDGENSSWTEAPIEETKADQSKNIQELQNKGIDSMKAELENEKDTQNTTVKEEAEVDNPIDSFQTANQDIKSADSSKNTNNCVAKQLPTAKPEELSSDHTVKESTDAAEAKEESIEDIVTNIPDGDNAENASIKEDCSQEPSLKDVTMGNNNAEEPTVAQEETPEDKENTRKTTSYEDIEENMLVEEDFPQMEQKKDLENDNENTSSREVLVRETTEGSLAKEEAQVEKPIETLQVPTEDIKASESCQETYSIDEKILSADPEETPCDKTEETTTNSTYIGNENLELQNVENVPNECNDDSQTEVEAPQKTSLEETSIGNNNDADSTIIHDAKFADENVVKADLLGNEESIESALAKEEVPLKSLEEEAQDEKPIDSSQAAREEIKASDSSQATNCLIEEKSLTAYRQETSSDKTERESIDAINRREESIANDFSNEDAKGTSTEHGEPRNIEFCENESAHSTALKIQSQIEKSEDHLRATSEDFNKPEIETRSCIEEQSATTHPQGILDKRTEDEAVVADEMEGSIENVPTIVSIEKTKDNSSIQVGGAKDHLEKDTEQPSQVEDFTGNLVTDEVKIDDEIPSRAELLELENEKDTESTSVKEEAEVDNPIDSLQTANQGIKASDSIKDTSNCIVEQLPTANPEELSSDQTVKESIDAAEAKEESIEDIVTNIPDGDNAENTSIEEDCSQEPSLKDATMGNNNAEEPTVAHEAKPVGENEKITECTLVKEEVSTESSALDQDKETSPLGEKSLTTKPQGIMNDTKVDKSNGAIVAEEETPEDKENIGKTTSYEDIEDNMRVEEDYPQLQQKKDLENTNENTSSREVLIRETTEGSLAKKEAQVEKLMESLQEPTEDIKASESCQETYSIDEKILSADPEEIPCDKTEETTSDSAYTENENLELQNVESVPNECSDNSQAEVEGPQKTSLEETSIGNNNDADSTIIHDTKFANEIIVKADVLGNEESIECALAKEEVPLNSLQEEAQEEKPIDSSQAAQEEIKASDSSQDTNCLIEEKSLTAYPQETSTNKTERESIDAFNSREESVEDIPDGDDAVNSPIEDGSQKPYLKEATTRNDNDDESTVTNEATLVGENEKDIECTLIKEQVSMGLLQVGAQDTKVSALGQGGETSSLEVQSETINPQGFMDETKEDKTSNATGAEEEIPEDKDVATAPYEDIEENLLVEDDCKQGEQNEDSVKDNDNTSLTEALIGDTVEGTLVKEEAQEEKHSESLQVATEDVQASDSCQEASSIEEQILTGDSQEISCDRIEEKTVDAANTKENLEEVATKIPNVSDEGISPIQVDSLQKPPLEEASTIIREAKFVDESKVKADLFQNETKSECGLVKEEESVKSLQVENEDIKPTASSQDREISHLKGQDLTTNPQEIVGDYREDKTIDVAELKEEALEDKSNAISLHEDTIENSLIQVDCIQLEQKEDLEKASESTSPAEAPTADTIENMLVKEKAGEEDHHIEALLVATEDIKASASCQETHSIEEQILTGDSQEISSDKIEENTINSAYTGNESFEDAARDVSSGNNEDSSPIEVVGSQKPSLKEASTENTNDRESTIRHDTKFADNLSENEKNIECDSVKEEASVKSLDVENEDTKAITTNQDRESGHIEEQGLITDPQGIKGEYKEDKIIDVTDLKEVTHEDKSNATISYENTTENSSVQVDCSQHEQNEHSEKETEITSLTEALPADNTDSKLVKEEAQNEDHTESLQVANEDIKAFSPCQDTETSSTAEQVLIADPEDISRDKIIEKTIDASDNEKTTEVQSYAATSYEDSKESSFVQVDCSQLEQNEHSEKDGESTSLTEAPAADTTESTLIMEEVQGENHIESLQAATEDVKAFAPGQDTKTSSTEEQIQTVDPEDISRDKTIENTTDASGNEKTLEVQEKNTEATLKEDAYTESSLEATEHIKATNSSEDTDAHAQEVQILSENPEGLKDENRESETFPKDEVPKEIGNIDLEARNIELKEEGLKDMSTSVNIAVHEEKELDSIAAKIPCTKDLDVVEEVAVGHLAKDPDSKQEESSIKEVPEVHMIISHENVPDVTSLAPEVVDEANSCGDKTDTEKIAVLDDGSTMIPTNETLPETDPRRGPEAEAQVPDGENEAQLVQNDPTTEIDQNDIEGQLLIKNSQVISESKGVNDKEEKTNSDNSKETSGSSNSGVLEEESTSNFQEPRREMREEAENEEAQQQEEELHVLAHVHDSSSGKIESHVQEIEKAPLHASDENIIETTEHNESEIVEDAIKNREGDDRTEIFFDDKKATEREQEEIESGQEKLTSDEKVQTTTSTSDLEVIDFHSILPSETSKVDHSINEGEVATDREELNAGKIASDGNEDTRIHNDRSITDLESKNDDEAPEIIQATLSASEGQDVENTSVGETTVLISECQRDRYEHANTSSTTKERPDSKEVVFEPGEQRSEYESKIQALEPVSQVQSGEIVAETEETKTEETAGEIESDKVVAEDISGQEETKHETKILKTEGDKDVEDYHQGSHQEEVVIGSHLEEEANQEEEISTGFEDIKKENGTEKVPNISKEGDDKALEEPEENLLGKESIDRGQDQKEQSKSVQEVTTAIETEEAQALDVAYIIGAQNSNEGLNRSTVAFPDEEENIAEDEGLLNQNSKIPEIDAAAREMPKELDENITCEAPINTFHKTIEDSEVMKESQEEHITRKHEILPLPKLIQGKDGEKHNQKDEICGSDEVQPRDEENVTHSEEKGEQESKGDTWSKPNEGEEIATYVEPEQLEFSLHLKDISEVPISDDAQVITEDDESPITKNISPEEDRSNKSTKSQISTVTDDTELTEQASEDTRITGEMQQPRAEITSQAAIPNATEVESWQVEEANDKCKVVAETSKPVEPPMISTSKITLEVEDQHTKLHDLPQELNIMDTEVMAEKDDPENVQNVRDVSQDAQGSNEGSFEVSHKENPVEASPNENIKTGEEQVPEVVQNASVFETLKQETEEQQLGRDPGNVTEAGVNSEEEKIINDKSKAETEKVSEPNTYQSLMDDTDQHDKVDGSPRLIDSLSILPEAKCPETETAEKDIPAHFAGADATGVSELEVTPLPSKDKHVVLEADHTTVLSSENESGNEKLSVECSQGGHDLLEPSKVEQQAADCGNEEKTGQAAEKPESKKTNEPSLSDLFEVSMRKNSNMAEHSAINEEPTSHTEDLHAEKTDEDQHENAKTEEENNDVDELSEQKRSELSSEAPVMLDMADADVKVSHKKSHNILSGVGSKMKHSIAKVKKAITGKSSHPKPPSPKKHTVEK